jgi:hypothetical protein
MSHDIKEPSKPPRAWVRWAWNRSVAPPDLVFEKPDPLPLSDIARGVMYDPLIELQKPMTKAEIEAHIGPDEGDREAVEAVVREVERWHGIGQENDMKTRPLSERELAQQARLQERLAGRPRAGVDLDAFCPPHLLEGTEIENDQQN